MNSSEQPDEQSGGHRQRDQQRHQRHIAHAGRRPISCGEQARLHAVHAVDGRPDVLRGIAETADPEDGSRGRKTEGVQRHRAARHFVQPCGDRGFQDCEVSPLRGVVADQCRQLGQVVFRDAGQA